MDAPPSYTPESKAEAKKPDTNAEKTEKPKKAEKPEKPKKAKKAQTVQQRRAFMLGAMKIIRYKSNNPMYGIKERQ